MAKKILIVEDDQFLRELMARKLKEEGFKILEAIDGEEGIRKMKKEEPDLVLLDLLLPGKDGFEVLKEKKEDPKIANIPVIIFSNLGQREDIEQGLKLGAIDYLIKASLAPSEIVEKVKNILR